MDLDLARQPLPVQRGTHEDLGQFGRTPSLNLDKRILLDDVRHLLFLLLTLIDLLLEIGDLLRN